MNGEGRRSRLSPLPQRSARRPRHRRSFWIGLLIITSAIVVLPWLGLNGDADVGPWPFAGAGNVNVSTAADTHAEPTIAVNP